MRPPAARPAPCPPGSKRRRCLPPTAPLFFYFLIQKVNTPESGSAPGRCGRRLGWRGNGPEHGAPIRFPPACLRHKVPGVSRAGGAPLLPYLCSQLLTLTQMPDQAYLLSLPERVVRSALGLSAGVLREAGELVLPAGMRRSHLYHSLVDVTLRYVIERVGGVKGTYPPEQAPGDDFLVRRGAGNAIELLGIVAFR